MRLRGARPVTFAMALLAGMLCLFAFGSAVLARGDDNASTNEMPPEHLHSVAAMDDVCRASGISSKFQRGTDAGMGRMMAGMHSSGHSGNVDVDFLAMMVPHHEGAVDMVRLVLEHGRDPATRMLAEEIIAGQTIEIESMRRRLSSLKKGAASLADSDFPALGGTRGP